MSDFSSLRIRLTEVVVQWCPTDKMCSNYLTKALCGEKFRHFRQKIMNLKPVKLDILISPIKKVKSSDSQEIVENNMSQVSNSLSEKSIRAVKNIVRKGMVNNIRRNTYDIPLRDRIDKQMHAGMIYPTKSKGIKEWCRIDKDCKHYVATWTYVPKWSDVISRTTYDMHSGTIINLLVSNEYTNLGDFHKKN